MSTEPGPESPQDVVADLERDIVDVDAAAREADTGDRVNEDVEGDVPGSPEPPD